MHGVAWDCTTFAGPLVPWLWDDNVCNDNAPVVVPIGVGDDPLHLERKVALSGI